MSARIYTTSSAQSDHFIVSCGEAYTTFALAMEIDGKKVAGPQQLMVKTVDLAEFADLAMAGLTAWKRAKSVEKEANSSLTVGAKGVSVSP